uniref:Uncharacterized protein n=1 Tax=Ciona intestinalis TaxID=7719 RepID=H2XSX5_CIOIN
MKKLPRFTCYTIFPILNKFHNSWIFLQFIADLLGIIKVCTILSICCKII